MTRARLDLGQRGEAIAAQHLERLGARVLARNYRTSLGEVDLLVEHDGDLVAVEVKTRHEGQPALPEEAVGPTKLARISRVLAAYAQEHEQDERGWRIDVVALEVDSSGGVSRVEHIRDAYE